MGILQLIKPFLNLMIIQQVTQKIISKVILTINQIQLIKIPTKEDVAELAEDLTISVHLRCIIKK